MLAVMKIEFYTILNLNLNSYILKLKNGYYEKLNYFYLNLKNDYYEK